MSKNEATVMAEVRLEAGKRGWRLWRNNSGAMMDHTQRLVRYGLGNEAAKQAVRSADLIGIRPVVITPDMVGKTIGQFVSVECKREHGGTVKPEQQAWCDLINALGGYAIISRGEL